MIKAWAGFTFSPELARPYAYHSFVQDIVTLYATARYNQAVLNDVKGLKEAALHEARQAMEWDPSLKERDRVFKARLFQ